jgi:DNA modification methylase
LAAIRSRIARMNSDKAREIALLALSRIVLAVSFQDSETRYSSRPRDILPGETLERFISALDGIALSVVQTKAILRYGVCSFLTADSRRLIHELDKPESVDLIVTSPPYGNANDYHLYHRFRLLWIGDDPRDLAKIEIGSHLRHQKESSGFDSYLTEIEQSLAGMFQVLRPGRYTVLIAGDATYKNTLYRITEPLSDIGRRIGFEIVCTIERSIHRTKRSFSPAGRRATTENLLVFRKPPKERLVHFKLPHYSLWPFEEIIRKREIETIIDATLKNRMDGSEYLKLDPYTLTKARRLVYTHSIDLRSGDTQPTWQAILENGFEQQKSARKDPKYVTHGLHPYKGKFYPQLAKGLINLSCISAGSAVFDPFCGSGTTLLESYLNGHRSFGCDMNPLAAKIARAKIGILELDPDIVTEATSALITRIEDAPSVPIYQTDQFAPTCTKEISTWFSNPIIAKINWLLGSIRSVSEGVIKDFFEIILSSIIRDISQQDPTDLTMLTYLSYI